MAKENNKVRFSNIGWGGMTAGKKVIKATVDFTVGETNKTKSYENELTVFVAAPRFFLPPDQIQAVFPPRDAMGDFETILPHIEFSGSELPWQRKSGIDDTPWLTLLLLQEDEYSDPNRVQEKPMSSDAYCTQVNSLAAVLLPEATDHLSDKEEPPLLKVLQIEPDFLKSVLPEPEEMKWLTNVRTVYQDEKESPESSRAFVVGNRLPRPGARARVHLIALEKRLKDNSFDFTIGLKDGKVPLLSLYSWEFICPPEQYVIDEKTLARLKGDALLKKVKADFLPKGVPQLIVEGKENFRKIFDQLNKEDRYKESDWQELLKTTLYQHEDFKALINKLDHQWMHLPSSKRSQGSETTEETAVDHFFKMGSIPLTHGLRKRGKTLSWYRSPLLADRNPATELAQLIRTRLPVRNSDQLLMYNNQTGMLDVSYAAAWELGRMLSVSDLNISQQIAQWKTSNAREITVAEEELFFRHIPFTDSNFVHQESNQLNEHLQQYFQDLSLLKGVPFHYLVPHESYLPDESVRYFYVDPTWQECLLDGAFSIGRHTSFDQIREARSDALTTVHAAEKQLISGILLRSDLVSGWPALQVEGYSEGEKQDPLPVLRFERLGSNVLLVLFTGEIKQLTIHLPTEALHFGFVQSASSSPSSYEYVKELKDLNTGQELGNGVNVKIPFRKDKLGAQEELRVIYVIGKADSQGLVADINSEIEGKKQKLEHSGQLAIQLIEGVPKLTVTV